MANLTQFDISYVQDVPSDGNQAVVAFHRLNRIAAIYFGSHAQFDFYECKALFELQWQKVGSWKASTIFKNVIAVKAMEAYPLFAVVGLGENGTYIALLGFDGSVKVNHLISHRKDALCADYNQKTREFFIGFDNGTLMCVYTNSHPAKNEYTITVKKVIKVHSDSNEKPKQILTQDLIGMVYILTSSGNIFCLETTKFDLVYSISRIAFMIPPIRLYCDKFGTDFLVHCSNPDRTKEQLECWHPPEDYAACRIGRFDRFTVPIPAQIVGLSFESVGLFSNKTLLQICTLNRKVYLWSCFGATSVNFEAELSLNVPNPIWKNFQNLIYSNQVLEDPFFLNLSEYYVTTSFLSCQSDALIKYTSILLMNFCQLTTVIGIQLPTKREQDLNLNYMDIEMNKMDTGLITADVSYSSFGTHQFHDNPGLPPNINDDENSVMSETLIGALSNLAEANRQIDEQMSRSHIDFIDSIATTSKLETHGDEPKISSHDHPPSGRIPTLSNKPNISDLMISDKRIYSSKPVPSIELQSTQFFPTFFMNNQDLTKCSNIPQVIQNFQFMKPDGMLLNEHYQLLMFTFQGLCYLSPDLMEKKLSIDLHSAAFRNGLISAVTSLKDCLVCDINNLQAPPMKIGFTISNHVKITTIVMADIQLKVPPYIPQTTEKKGKSDGKQQQQPSSAALANRENIDYQQAKFIMIAAGDSEGNVHIFIFNSNFIIFQTETFKAHSLAIKNIVFSGDSTRPLWNINADYNPSSNKIMLNSIVGSAIITASIEGEVKIWQPFSMEHKNLSLEKIFQNCHVRWKVSGVFVVNRTFLPDGGVPESSRGSASARGITAVTTSKPTTASSVKKMREIVSVCLAPGCLNVLIAYTNGTIEEWSLPGILDTNDSTLSTAQKEIWANTKLHNEDITTLRVYVHGSLSSMKNVSFQNDHERDATFVKLSSFIRVPNRMKYTAGLTFQEMKNIANSSSLISCSKDNSLVLWSFQSSFFGHCSYLIPVPIRKFYFSGIPSQGLCYCLDLTSGQGHGANQLWKIETIVNGKLQTVAINTRTTLFGYHEDHDMLTDNRHDTLMKTGNLIKFEDEDSPTHRKPSLQSLAASSSMTFNKNKIVMAIPVITPIFKAQHLVNGYHSYNNIYDPLSVITGNVVKPSLVSTNLLEEWGKSEPIQTDPIVATIQITDRPPSSRKNNSNIREIDPSVIPEFQDTTSKNFQDYLSDLKVSRSRSPSPRRARERSLSPIVIQIPSFTGDFHPPIDEFPPSSHPGTRPTSTRLNESPSMQRKKLAMNGIHMVVDEDTDLSKLEEKMNQKFVLDKTPVASPRKPIFDSTSSRPNSHQQQERNFEIENIGQMMAEGQLPTEEENRSVADRSNLSTPSGRSSTISVDLNFKKDSKIVKTINDVDDGEIGGDQHQQLENHPPKIDEVHEKEEVKVKKEPPPPKLAVHTTKAMELRQKMQAQLKERLDLKDQHAGNIHGGDARQSTKKVYVSKTSTSKQDLQQLQKGVKQTHMASGRVVIQKQSSPRKSSPERKESSSAPNLEFGDDHRTHPTNEEGEAAKEVIDDEDQSPRGRSRGRPPTIITPKFVVRKKKDDAKKITHQYIVAKSKLHREKTLRNLRGEDEGEGDNDEEHDLDEDQQHDDAEYQGDIANLLENFQFDQDHDSELEGDEEGKSQLDLESNAVSLQHSEVDGIKIPGDLDLTQPFYSSKTPKASSPKNQGGLDNSIHINLPKKQHLQLDLPDKKKETRRKYALAISHVMSEKKAKKDEFMSVVHAAMAKSGIFNDKSPGKEENEADDGSIVHYFDRSAKPIFVDRGKPSKHILKKRRRKGAGGGSSFSSRRSKGSSYDSYDSYDDDEDEDPELVQELNAAILDMYLEDLSPEERKMFENLDEESKKKLLREMRRNVGTGKRKNNKAKDLFQKLTKLATEQAKMKKTLSMEVTVESLEITDESLSMSVSSDVSGPIVVVLAYTKAKQPTKEQFSSSTDIVTVPGYIEHRFLTLTNDNFQELTFTGLRPETNYTIFSIVNPTSREHFPITDEPIDEEEVNNLIKSPKLLTLKTLEEKLEIEWSRLDLTMRTIELRAAIRSEIVQIKSLIHYPVIHLPTDAEILSNECQELLSPDNNDDKLNEIKEKYFNNNLSVKHIPIFLDWWIGHMKATSKTRAYFHELESFHALMNKKIQKSLLEDKIFSMKEINALLEFVKTNIKTRTRLNREDGITNIDSYDAHDDKYIFFKKFRSWYKGGFVIKELEIKQQKNLLRQSFSQSSDSQHGGDRALSGYNSPALNLTSQNVSRLQSRSNDDPDEPSTSIHIQNDMMTRTNSSMMSTNSQQFQPTGILAHQRLVERTEFLTSCLDNVDTCMQQITKLFEGYELVCLKGFRIGDLKTKRSSMSAKEAKHIMEAKKFLDLCLIRKVITKNPLKDDDDPFPLMELHKIDPFKHVKKTRSESNINMTPTSKGAPKIYPISSVIQRISGADLFRHVNVNTLKPDEPPPLELKTLPGSTRRPNKPWQSLSKQEQDLELALACSLDSIWELAVNDGINVPSPEDRLLPANEFPLRACIWEKFRTWYAGEEDTEPIPGQGIPTLARVIFSEQTEMPQVENDSFVKEMLIENAFPLPKPPGTETNSGAANAKPVKKKSIFSPPVTTPGSKPLFNLNEDGNNNRINSFDNNDENDEDDDMAALASRMKPEEAITTMRQAYEKAISSPNGAFIRNELMNELLNKILKSRLMNVMKFLWPPQLKRIGLQYVFPRALSFYYPKFTLPLYRFHLFPSRNQLTYNREEILSWYNRFELEEDDAILIRAEKKGVKQRAYHEWLTLEPQRMEYSRLQMAIEDSMAYQHRELQQLLEKRWKIQEERLIQLDEAVDNGELLKKEREATKISNVTLTPREERYKKLFDELQRQKEAAAAAAAAAAEEEEGDDDEEEEDEDDDRVKTPSKGGRFPGPIKQPSYASLGNESVMTPLSVAAPPVVSKSHPAIDQDQKTEEFKKFISDNMNADQQDDLSQALSAIDRPLSRMHTGRTTHRSDALSTGRRHHGEDEYNDQPDEEAREEMEPLGEVFDPTKFNFRIFSNLPQEYWYIFEESFEFKNGSGIYNDDEVEERKALEEERAKKAVEDALEFERVLNVEKKKRQMEELARLKREEQDRRLKEGMARRRKIREHLEELKAARLQKQAEEAEAKRIAAEEERIRKEREERERKHFEYITKLENQRQLELSLMEKEEIYMRDLKIRNRELKLMEHEDILSFLIEQMELQYQLVQEQRKAELEMIYEPFEPFRFKKSRLSALEQMLYYADDAYQQQIKEKELLEQQLLTTSQELSSMESFYDGVDGLEYEQPAMLIQNQDDHHHHHHQNHSQIRFEDVDDGRKSPLVQSLIVKTNDKEKRKQKLLKEKKKDQFAFTTPLPQSHDQSVISFQTLSKNVPSIHQKIAKVEHSHVRTGDHLPTKRKLRKFFDYTTLNLETLQKPLKESISIDSSSNTTANRSNSISNPVVMKATITSVVPPAAAHSHADKPAPIAIPSGFGQPLAKDGKTFKPMKVSSPVSQQLKPSSAPKETHRPTSSNNQKYPQQPQHQAPILPFNPYDTQWELQQSPPVALTNLPFFVRPTSRGLNPFKSHDEQALSTPNLNIPIPSATSSRPNSRSLQQHSRGKSRERGDNRHTQSQPRLLSPINRDLLSRPMAVSQSMPVLSPPSPPQYTIGAERATVGFSPQLAGMQEDDGRIEHDLLTLPSTDSVQMNKTTELTIEYVNSLLAESSEELPYPTASHRDQDNQQKYDQDDDHQDYYEQSQEDFKRIHPTASSLEGSSLTGGGVGSKKSKTSMKVKEMHSLAAEIIERTEDPKQWMEFLRIQKQLTTASLSTLDSIEKDRLKKILGKGGVLPVSAQIANNVIHLPVKQNDRGAKLTKKLLSSTLPGGGGGLSPIKSPTAGTSGLSIDIPTDTQQQHGQQGPPSSKDKRNLFANSLLDFKTFQLARSASESVLRIKEQREILKQYIAGHALLEEEKNEYYLLACEPGIHEQTILERNKIAQQFAKEIHDKLNAPDITHQSQQQQQQQRASPSQQLFTPAAPAADLKPLEITDEENSLHLSEDTNSLQSEIVNEYENSMKSSGRPAATPAAAIAATITPIGPHGSLTSSTSNNLKKSFGSSLGMPSVPPPQKNAAKQQMLLLQTNSSLLSPLKSNEESFPNNNKKKTHLFHQLTDPHLSAAIGSSEIHNPPTKKKGTNPFILGSKATIHKENKKDILQKSKQTLLQKPFATGPVSVSQRPQPSPPRTTSANKRPKSKEQLRPLSSSTSAPAPFIQLDPLDPVDVNSPNAADLPNALPLPSLADSSLELKTGRSLDLFIKTPRVDENIQNEKEHGDTPNEKELIEPTEVETPPVLK